MEVIDKLSRYAGALGDFEASLNNDSETNLVYENDSFKNLSSGNSTVLCVRITKSKKSGFAKTTNLLKWKDCVDSAVKLMRVNEPLLSKPVLSRTKFIKGFDASLELNNLSNEELIKSADSAISGVKEVNNKITVAGFNLSIKRTKNVFANSLGVQSSYETCNIESSVECVLGQASGFDYRAGKRFDIDYNLLGREAGKLCVDSLNPKKIQTQVSDLTIGYFGLIELVSLLSHNLMGSNVVEHKSIFKDKVGSEVLSPMITLIDDATIPRGINSYPFDGEGTDSCRTELITKGVLKGFIHDNYTSKLMGVKSTGNCAGLELRPNILNSNVIINEGRAGRDELLSDGLYTHSLMGSHMANPISGDFALNLINAFKIDNGRMIPVRDAMLSGNLFDLWKSVKAVGNESRYDAGVVAPLIKFGGAQIVA